MATSVVLDKVVKNYGTVPVIHGIDLRIDPGEFAVFVGPSGCGKSTLLRMIAGLEEISGGALMLDGERMNEVPAAKRGIAMVFQSYALYPHMSVYKNLAFGLETAGLKKAEIEPRVRRAAADPAHRAAARAQAQGALRRPAPARGDRPRHRARAEDLPVRRAPVEPRRRAPGADARRDLDAAPRPRQHDDLRHPRPGRGDDHGRQDRGAERRPDRAGRRAARALQPPGQPLRRRLHRQPEDELPRRPRSPPARRARRSSRSAARTSGCRARCPAPSRASR